MVGQETRINELDFGSGSDLDAAYRRNTKRKLFSLAEVSASTECRRNGFHWNTNACYTTLPKANGYYIHDKNERKPLYFLVIYK